MPTRSEAPPAGRYRALVIDPPWPLRPSMPGHLGYAPALPYPTLPVETIAGLGWCGGALPVDPTGCHVYLWVTHRFLPAGLDCLARWGVRYECVLTWVKNVGVTPFSWMYSTEHVLFGRIGALPMAERGLRIDFAARRREHSRKPEVFYDLVRWASPGPRLELFARERRAGFDAWGLETDRFSSTHRATANSD